MIKKFKIFEKLLKNFPVLKSGSGLSKDDTYKYKEGDYVKFKENGQIYMISSINKLSDNQDYYIKNPLFYEDRAWVVESEIELATNKEILDTKIKIELYKYNIDI